MPASVGFKASPVDKSNPTGSPNAAFSSNNLTIVSCGSNPLLIAEIRRKILITIMLTVLVKLIIKKYVYRESSE